MFARHHRLGDEKFKVDIDFSIASIIYSRAAPQRLKPSANTQKHFSTPAACVAFEKRAIKKQFSETKENKRVKNLLLCFAQFNKIARKNLCFCHIYIALQQQDMQNSIYKTGLLCLLIIFYFKRVLGAHTKYYQICHWRSSFVVCKSSEMASILAKTIK